MMKLLHSADWHLDAPMVGKDEDQAAFLRTQLRKVPEKVAKLCKQEDCRLLLLSGDLFDGEYTKESYRAVYDALKELDVPVFIAPGNHDFCRPGSPWLRESWPENVHIFTKPVMESVPLPELNCVIYGAGYQAMDCPPLLKDFHAEGEGLNIGILHGDATVASSPYCPITSRQFRESGLHYLALGHIHGPQNIGSERIRYCGTPLKYSFSEAKHQKSITVVELGEKGSFDLRTIPLTPLHDLREIRGSYDQVTAKSFYENTAVEDYLHITLTDEEDVPEAMARLRVIYPNLMKLTYDNARTRSNAVIDGAVDVRKKSPLQLFGELYEQQNNQPMSEVQNDFMRELIESIWEGEK